MKALKTYPISTSDRCRSSLIAGAAVDVYTSEPLGADSVLRGIPGILRTPHLGYVTRQNYEIYFREALEAIVAFAQGSPIRVIADGT